MNKLCIEFVNTLKNLNLLSLQESERTIVSWVENRSESFQLYSSHTTLSEMIKYCQGFFSIGGATNNDRRLSVLKLPSKLEELAMHFVSGAVPIPNSCLRIASIKALDANCYIRFNNRSLYDVTLFCKEKSSIYVSSVAGPPEYLALARLLRNATVSKWGELGGICMHAAAVDINGRAVLLLGEKYSGKTTILCEMLCKGSVRFISNDRAIVMPNGMVRGLPVSVNIRAATMQLYKPLSQMAECGVANQHRIGLSYSLDDVSLSVTKFVEAFGVEICAERKISLIVIIKRDELVDDLVVKSGTFLNMGHLITQNKLDEFDYSQPFWPHNDSNFKNIMAMFGQAGISIVGLTVGRNRISDAAQTIRTLAELTVPEQE